MATTYTKTRYEVTCNGSTATFDVVVERTDDTVTDLYCQSLIGDMPEEFTVALEEAAIDNKQLNLTIGEFTATHVSTEVLV